MYAHCAYSQTSLQSQLTQYHSLSTTAHMLKTIQKCTGIHINLVVLGCGRTSRAQSDVTEMLHRCNLSGWFCFANAHI